MLGHWGCGPETLKPFAEAEHRSAQATLGAQQHCSALLGLIRAIARAASDGSRTDPKFAIRETLTMRLASFLTKHGLPNQITGEGPRAAKWPAFFFADSYGVCI